MKVLVLILFSSILISGCKEPEKLKKEFMEKQVFFKKLENPIKSSRRYLFTKDSISNHHELFDSNYMFNIKQIFNNTTFDIIDVIDSDVFIGHKGNSAKICFTRKNEDGIVELLNYRGTLKYLLDNGKKLISPYAIKIGTNWYIIKDIESL